MALPEFQRGYVWNRDQVRGLFDSLYRRHPVGGLLVWATESGGATYRGDAPIAAGVVKLILDGQQRITSLYGVVRGQPPKFFDGHASAFTGLRFHLDTQTFAFYQPLKMQDDPSWIDVSGLMKSGMEAVGPLVQKACGDDASKMSLYLSVLSRLLSIVEVDLHIEEVTGKDKTLEVVVDIFNRVNSGGTKLSKGDLALAKICADWPQARDEMKKSLKTWRSAGYDFDLDWLLRSVNTVMTGEAKFSFLHDKSAGDVKDGLLRAVKRIDASLNMIGGRLGLDHDRVLFGRFGVPVMVRFLEQRNGLLDAVTRDKLLFWFVQSGMWGRFSGSTESYIDQDLGALEKDGDPLENLLEQLRLWHGGMRVEPGHFSGWSLGARFYPVLYMLTRMGEARDWGTGLPLKSDLLGKMSKLEVHHIFPKAQLYKHGFQRAEVNAVANFCFLTKDTNLVISDQLPEAYFVEVESKHPGALASQWIPSDPALWNIHRYRDFLEARRELLAAETNRRLAELLHGDDRWLSMTAKVTQDVLVVGGIASEVEEAELVALNDWLVARGLPAGRLGFEIAEADTGQPEAILDVAWPNGIQEELSAPVAVLLNESSETMKIAARSGYRAFTNVDDFKQYVAKEILGDAPALEAI